LTEVFKGAAVGAVTGAVDAGAKIAGFDNKTEAKAAASKVVKKAVNPNSPNTDKRNSVNKKTGKGK